MVFPRETVTVPGQNGDSACDGQPFQAREAIPRETVEVFMCVWGRVWLHWRWHVRLGTLAVHNHQFGDSEFGGIWGPSWV